MEVLSKILAEFFTEGFWAIRSKSLLISFFEFGLKILHVSNLGFKFVYQEFLNGKNFVWAFNLFGFDILAPIVEELLVWGDLGFGDLIGLKKFLKIIFYVAGFLVFLASIGLGPKQVLHLTLVEFLLLDIVFLELEILLMDGLIFIGVNYKLDSRVKRFKDFVKCGNVGLLDLDKGFIETPSAMVKDLSLSLETGFFDCALVIFFL